MGLLDSLDEGRLGSVLLLFMVFLAVSVFGFSAGRPRALLKGLFWTLMDLIVAPFAYIRYAVFRLAQEGGKSIWIEVADPQFLLRTMVRVQLAVLFFALSLIGAVGLLVAVDQAVPPEAAEARRQALKQLEVIRSQELPSIERDLREIETKLGNPEAIEQELGGKRATAAKAEAQVSRLRSGLAGGDSGEHFARIEEFLRANATRIRSKEGRNEIRSAIKIYLAQAPTSVEFDTAVMEYLDRLFEKAERDSEIEAIKAANSAEALLKKKAELQDRLAWLRQQIRTLERDASWIRLLGSVSTARIGLGLLLLLVGAWAVLWLGGLTIEWSELAIDIATNLRRLRRLAEGVPQGTMIHHLAPGHPREPGNLRDGEG
ncbi:MAG: hypothetical protein ACUVS7_13630 [Bryobacteraceae bacterium]